MNTGSNALSFLDGGGNVAQLIALKDWSNTRLGAPLAWPGWLRAIVNLALNSKFPMFIAVGEEHEFLYNDAYAEILGGKHPQALGARFADVWSEIWDDIHPIVQQSMQGVASHWKNMPLVTDRKGHDEQTWFTFSYSPVRDGQGSIAGMYCVCVETTNEVLAERHRAQEIDRMRELFRQAPGFTAVVRQPGHVFELANDAFMNLIGQRDIIGMSLLAALPEMAQQVFLDALNCVCESGEPFVGNAVSLKLQRRPGQPLEERVVDFVYQPIRSSHGTVSGVFIQGNDVTDAVRATRALRESEERLRLLANTIPQMAWVAHPNGIVHWYNDRWCDYTGASPDMMQTLPWEHFCAADVIDGVRRLWWQCVHDGVPFEGTFPLRSAADEYRMFYTRMVPLKDALGAVVQWFGTSTDVTVLEEAKTELKAADARKDAFLAMLAHELRNPLAPIRASADILKLEGMPRATILHACNVIGRQVGNLTRQLDDLLDVARVTRGLVSLHPAPCALSELVAEAAEQIGPLFQSKRHAFTVELPAGNVLLEVDKVRMVQVLANILDNAAKYTPPMGSISLLAVTGPGSVTITIADTGVGISEQLLPHVFESFTQAERSPDRAQGGLGLGLALVKNLVQLHGGVVLARSEGSGRGSQFAVTLPLSLPPPAGKQNVDGDAVVQAGTAALQVAVVDDNQDAAQMIAELLDINGYTTHVRHSSQAALELAGAVDIDVFILDIGLPGVDGCELARRLRSVPASAGSHLIALTGYGQPEDRRRTAEAGFDVHLVKPADFAVVLSVLSDMAQRRLGVA